MRRHFSPPQLLFSSLPIPPLPPTLCIPPPLPSPSYPSYLPRPSAPSHTITWLFFYPSTSFSIFFSSFFSSSHFTLPCISFLLFLLIFFLLFPLFYIRLLFLPFSSSLHHPALSIYRPVIFFFVVLLLLPALLVLLSTFSSFSYFSPSPHSLPPSLVSSAAFPPTLTVPQLQQSKSAARNLKRYVL